ncbi:putative secreted protein (Por secretion system target) [Kordia periserrulae]|uniref:Putative secreted protein (Por secretion system target) n=1 Tax=Kordia periserrulae TaxID=701523 RepID=A0A2T6C5P5_9FLAO|nr:choice-of-anchor J domain-containing protein [Kordia periserrulae]PTX63651.1 putative secreted protein (Por secretion system target) [Kordia periserrulae]
MKKITLLLFTCIFFQFGFAQLSEDFESSATIPAGWTSFIGTNGLGTVQNWQVNDGATNNVAFVTWEAVTGGNSEDWLVTPQFTVDATNFILSFDQSDSFATDYGSTYTIRVSTNTQTTHADFVIVDTQTEADVWSGGPLAQHTVDLSAYIGQPIYVAFVLEQNDGDRWIIDNVEMIANATAPDPATTPTPADMATGVVIDPADDNMDGMPDNSVSFAWQAATTGDPATAYDVYLGDSPTTLNLLGTLGATSVDITGMQYSTQYYWQIVAKNVGGDAMNSPIWSFTTEADPLSVEEVDTSNFILYPNPTTGIVQFQSTQPINKLKVINFFGQEVLRVDEEVLTNKQIDLSTLRAGTYIMIVTIGDNTSSYKVVKQ